jgi:hypothetical protein
MKRLTAKASKEILGGATHYHWVCTVNNFWSKKYTTRAAANNALENHWKNYPDHRSKTYVTKCTGATCS